MGKKKPRKQAAPEADEGDALLDDSDIEEADIQALARERLKPGERILGDGDALDDDEEDAGDDSKSADAPVKRGVCIAPLLLQRLTEIDYKVPEGAKRVPWVDTLLIDGQTAIPKGVTAKDGVKLESTFLGMAAEAAREGYRRLRVMKIPCNRPNDFYAEMMRSDKDMYKVRQQAAEEERRMKIVEQRKKAQAGKKFAKQAKSKKLEARATEKRKTLEQIAEWQVKSKQDRKNTDEQDLEDILNRQQNKRKNGAEDGKGKGKGKGKAMKSEKRKKLDEKYGFGGKKKRRKQNDSKSADDMSRSPWGSGKGRGKGKGKGKGKSKGKSKRR
eukprot:TRINITY_DN52900_c0_g1_i1.p1 TRINITY_DN52900_c0_g1~~TRINITY_DN52900_c0_g1_i1.p1  ORF type:complete len:329 (-),score=88.96 TRINITY_DN52900_c0_g1_i1:56-1042(-)